MCWVNFMEKSYHLCTRHCSSYVEMKLKCEDLAPSFTCGGDLPLCDQKSVAVLRTYAEQSFISMADSHFHSVGYNWLCTFVAIGYLLEQSGRRLSVYSKRAYYYLAFWSCQSFYPLVSSPSETCVTHETTNIFYNENHVTCSLSRFRPGFVHTFM